MQPDGTSHRDSLMDFDDLVLTAQALASMSDKDVSELAGDPVRDFAAAVLVLAQDYERAERDAGLSRKLALEVGCLRASQQLSNGFVNADATP
jgi:hypothetical protein